MEYPVFKLLASSKQDLPSHTLAINKEDMEYNLWIYLPPKICKHLDVYEFSEYGTDTSVPIQHFVQRKNNVWLKVASGVLNRNSGQHIYKIGLVDIHTKDTIHLYVSYILHTDNPDTPYVYMKRGRC